MFTILDMSKAPSEIEKDGWRIYTQYGRDIHSGRFVEAICPHGVGHHKGVHGCHMSKINEGKACCADAPKEIWKVVSKD